jgi:hypothetical protein
MADETIESVIKKHSQRLMALPGVTGIAQGEYKCKPCIRVYITRKTKELKSRIPSNLDGYAVIVEESGSFQALSM